MTNRIFHIQLGTDGGTERFFARLTRALADRGMKQAFAMRQGVPLAKETRELGPVWEGVFLRRTPRGIWQANRLRRAIARWEPDVVLAWRAPAARMVPDLPSAAKLVRLGDYPRHVRHFGHLNALVVNAPKITEHCKALGWTGRTSLISNFPEEWAGEAAKRAELGIPNDVTLAGYVGRMVPTKGVDTLIAATAKVPGMHLVLAGDGPELSNLRNLAAEFGIAERVHFLGWVDDPLSVVAACDFFVMPSRDEPLGNVMVEAWKVGCPVLTTQTAGPAWFATPEADCLMVPVDDVDAMAASMVRLKTDPELRSRLAASATNTLRTRFSRDTVVSAYASLFSDIIGDVRS